MICFTEVSEVTPEMYDFLLLRRVSMSGIETVVFTGPDKSLLDRSARAAEAAAKALRWESILDSKRRKAAKLEYDRLLRDAHDLRQLGVRLSKLAKMLRSAPVAATPAVQTVRSGLDRRSVDRGASAVGVAFDRRESDCDRRRA